MSTAQRPTPLVRAQWRRPADNKSAVPGLVLAAWAALVVNALTFAGIGVMLLPIPVMVGQLITQGSLVLALFLALAANPRGLLRPNLFLVLLTVFAVLGLMVSVHNEFVVGSTYRASRFLLFILVLWLLTPWWGRPDMLLLRCHRRVYWIVLGTVLVGAAMAPGQAFSFQGRLAGVLWPMWPTGVAHVGAILFGSSVLLWMCRMITGRHASVALAISGAVLVATHTRTATVGTLLGLAVATASLFLGNARARRVSAFSAVTTVVAATFFASALTTWALRGQTAHEARQLTGRTDAWAAVFAAQRPTMQELFGSGLSNQSINGRSIDSGWVATFYDLGLLGVVIQAAVFLVLIAMAVTKQRGPQRAVGLFLVSYVLVASLTETGVGTASLYLLDLTVAAVLLSPPLPRGAR